MNWSEMKLPRPKNPRPQVGELSNYDYWRFVVAGKLTRKSMAAVAQTAVLNYLQRVWPEHESRLAIEANEQGLTPEELFMKYVEEENN